MNKKNKLCASVFFLFFLSVSFSPAQKTPSTSSTGISPEKLALIKEYFEVSGSRETFKQKLDSVFDSLNKALLKQISADIEQDASLSSEEKAKKQKAMPEIGARLLMRLREEFNREINFEKFVEDANYPLLDKYFTDDELKQLIAIYQSPVWKKSVTVRQRLQTETSQAFVDTLSSTIEKILPRVRAAEMEDLRKRSRQDK